MVRSILIHPDPRLRKPCEAVAAITPEIEGLGRDLLKTMYDAPGIGLAAPQVGVMKRIIAMDCIKNGPPEPIVLLNPKVTWSSEDQSTYEEGCLSIPDQYAEVRRPASVNVCWLGLDGETHERHFEGLWATCVQHEIDHLDGRLFIDYLGPLKRQMITRKMEKLKRELARGGQ
jgi:peptide deformylase